MWGYNPARATGDLQTFFDVYDEMDPNNIPKTIPEDIRKKMWGTIDTFLPKLSQAEVVDEWVGIRSVTPDGNPIVGKTSIPGFSVAAFHTSGIQLSPKVGEIIARQLVNNKRDNLHQDLSISRFEGYTEKVPESS